jgi:hypothetical protein
MFRRGCVLLSSLLSLVWLFFLFTLSVARFESLDAVRSEAEKKAMFSPSKKIHEMSDAWACKKLQAAGFTLRRTTTVCISVSGLLRA